eukprot:361735-Chlamydomonas_euryale.AAC.4
MQHSGEAHEGDGDGVITQLQSRYGVVDPGVMPPGGSLRLRGVFARTRARVPQGVVAAAAFGCNASVGVAHVRRVRR